MPWSTKKVEDQETICLKQILDENSCQTQLELASELGVTQVIFYRLEAGKDLEGILVGL